MMNHSLMIVTVYWRTNHVLIISLMSRFCRIGFPNIGRMSSFEQNILERDFKQRINIQIYTFVKDDLLTNKILLLLLLLSSSSSSSSSNIIINIIISNIIIPNDKNNWELASLVLSKWRILMIWVFI